LSINPMTDASRKPPPSQPSSNYPPPGWGEDELTKFLDAACSNQWATFWNKRGLVEKMIRFCAWVLQEGRPEPALSVSDEE
jgi:hypothetical protein